MFTGLVDSLGTVTRRTPDGAGGARLTITCPFGTELTLGESVAVNGACLTVVEHTPDAFHAQLGPESLLRTNLGELKPGDRVNLERSLRVGDRLGGHIVQGHVDGVGRIAARERSGEWETVWFTCPPDLTPLMVPRGSVAVDGVSLTLVDVGPDRFGVMLIPHTLAMTTLGIKKVGDAVNLEADMLAKHVAKLLEALKPRLG
jgi:riboflavin synthase